MSTLIRRLQRRALAAKWAWQNPDNLALLRAELHEDASNLDEPGKGTRRVRARFLLLRYLNNLPIR